MWRWHGPEGNEPRIGETENERFKRQAEKLIWPSLVLAAAIHYAVLAWFPAFTARNDGPELGAGAARALVLLPEITPPPVSPPLPRPSAPAAPPEIELPIDFVVDAPTYDPMPFDDEIPPPPAPPPSTPLNPPPPPIDAGDRFTPSRVTPELRNREEVTRALRRNYPSRLVNAGIGGTVVMWFWIDEDGNVERHEMKISSGHAELDAAAERVVKVMKFSPLLENGRGIAVMVELPIVFRVN